MEPMEPMEPTMEPTTESRRPNPAPCKAAASVLPDLLLSREAASAFAKSHLEACPDCRRELSELESTMTLLSELEAPEPSPYWTVRMNARLREEQARPPGGWQGFKERMRTRIWLSNHSLKPAAGVATLGLLLAVGGGAWLDTSSTHTVTPATQASNTVRDLQSLNENAQVFQQLSALDAPDGTQAGAD